MTIQPLVFYTQVAAKPSRTFATIKNFFTGKFFQEWKMHMLTAGTIYYVAKAALSFFTGYWMLSLIEFLTAGMFSILRKDIRDFTNHYRVMEGYQKQNSRYEQNNLEFRGRLEDMRGENEAFRQSNEAFRLSNKELEQQIQAFSEQMGVLRSENRSYSFNNGVHASLLKDLGATSVRLAQEVRLAINGGQEINQKLLETIPDCNGHGQCA